ncbi:MAG: type II secretion system protein [Bacilli bacterium]|nr:type II secretion system protein [Bacilli bacterium]
MKKLNKKGFTLTEMIVVIAIIGILAGVLIPAVTSYIKKAQKSNDEQLAASMTDEIERYCIDNNIDQEDLLGTDIRTILYQSDYNLVPKYSKWTYVYDINDESIKLIDFIDNGVLAAFDDYTPLDPTHIEKNYFLIGEGKSNLEQGIKKLCSVKSQSDYDEAKKLLSDTEYTEIAVEFDPSITLYINNTGCFTTSNTESTVKLVYNLNTFHISNFKLNDIKLASKLTVSQVIKTIEIDAESKIYNLYTKASIKKIGPGNLNGTGVLQLDVDEMVRSKFGDEDSKKDGIYFYFGENVEGSIAQVIEFNGTSITVKYFNENGLYAYGFKAN